MTSPCTVSGNIKIITGDVAGTVLFSIARKLQQTLGQYGDVVIPNAYAIMTDPAGSFSTDLYPGNYTGTINGVSFDFAVPETATENLADLIPPISGIVITPSLVAETKGYRDEAEAAAVLTAADRVATGQDRVQTGLDRVATAADRVATGQDRVQTGLDRVATAADRVATGLDADATAADRAAIETNLLVYVADDITSVTIAVSDTMVVTESESPYPSVTLEFATP